MYRLSRIYDGKRYCKEAVKRLMARVYRVRSEFQESESWYLLQDIHSTGASFGHCLRIFGETVDPCFPYLALAGLLLFSKFNILMKGTRFEAVSSIQQTVTRKPKPIQADAFSWVFDPLYGRCKRRAESGRDYTEP
jgi:hypothetical protein